MKLMLCHDEADAMPCVLSFGVVIENSCGQVGIMNLRNNKDDYVNRATYRIPGFEEGDISTCCKCSTNPLKYKLL